MKLSLLFLENLKSQIKKLLKSYPSLDETTIKLLNSADPTGDEAKYTKWLVQQYFKGNIDLDNGFAQRQKIRIKLAIFDKYPWKFPNNQIYKLDVKDLLETEAVYSGKINYSELLRPPNKLIKKTRYYKLIEINAYQGMEQFKQESDTVPAGWCVAYPRMFKHYGPPMYLTIKNEEPYVMIVYHKDELKDRNDKPIKFDVFKELLDLGFIDVSKLKFNNDSERFIDYFIGRYNFNELLKFNNANLLTHHLKQYPHDLNKDQFRNITINMIRNSNDYVAAKMYGDITNDNKYELLKELILKNMDNPEWAYWYAIDVIGHRWEPAEKIIINANDPEYAYMYTMVLINKRWEPAERIIINTQNAEYAYYYALEIIQGRWLPAEKIIINSNSSGIACGYAIYILKSRWAVAEEIIKNSDSPHAAYAYAKDLIKGRWLPAEKIILKTKEARSAFYYARDIIKNRWPEAEPIINQDIDYWYRYEEFLEGLQK